MAWFRSDGGSGKTSFVWRVQNLSGGINLKRNGNTVKFTGVGSDTGAGGSYKIRVFGTTADNLTVNNIVSETVTLIQEISVDKKIAETEVDVSAYDRFIIWVVYGSGTISGENIYLQVEN